jgi:hypothetical protein
MTRFQIETTLSAADCERAAASTPAAFGIYIRMGAAVFPSADWRDFGIVILGWWAAELRALKSRQTDVATLRFMEGPYELRITVVSDDRWLVSCVHRGRSETILAESAVNPAQVIKEHARASTSLLKMLDHANCWTDECEELASLVFEKRRSKGDAPHVTGN